jgi:hypothetical protein
MDAPPEAPTPEPAEDESDFDEDDLEFVPPKGRWGPHGDRARHGLGTGSVSSGSGSVTSTEQMLTPTTGGMVRPWSTKTTESYGSTNTTTSDGGRSIGLGTPVSGLGAPGTGVQIVHGANGEIKERVVSGPWQSPSAKDNRYVSYLVQSSSPPPLYIDVTVAHLRLLFVNPCSRCLPLLPDETPIFSSPIFLPASSVLSKSLHLPGSKARERLLVLTDFPRLLCVKQDKHTGVLKVKSECLILRRGTGASRLGPLQVAGGGNVLKGVKEKGSKGFSVQTVSSASALARSRTFHKCLKLFTFLDLPTDPKQRHVPLRERRAPSSLDRRAHSDPGLNIPSSNPSRQLSSPIVFASVRFYDLYRPIFSSSIYFLVMSPHMSPDNTLPSITTILLSRRPLAFLCMHGLCISTPSTLQHVHPHDLRPICLERSICNCLSFLCSCLHQSSIPAWLPHILPHTFPHSFSFSFLFFSSPS